ncbi:NepR family anti-sigma factor [Methylobacterium variabile]|jgi:hypothetical protein|nr:NepR family anti-sigma factor [Methylobacterium variabile]
MGAAGAGRRMDGTQRTVTLSLGTLGAGLAAAYDGLMAEAVPERLAALLRQLELREMVAGRDAAGDPPDRAEGGPAPVAFPAGRYALLVGEVPGTSEAEALVARAGLEALHCPDPDAGLDVLRLRGGEVALVLIGLPEDQTGSLDGAGLARAVATLWPTIHLVVAHPAGGETRTTDPGLPPRAVSLSGPRDLLTLAEHAARQPRPPVA